MFKIIFFSFGIVQRAGPNVGAGCTWPAGRSLGTPGLDRQIARLEYSTLK